MLSRPPLDQETLQSVLSTLYPQDPREHAARLAGFIMREIDVKEQGTGTPGRGPAAIDGRAFVTNCQETRERAKHNR